MHSTFSDWVLFHLLEKKGRKCRKKTEFFFPLKKLKMVRQGKEKN